MPITLCVLLWVKVGKEELFIKYEDRALQIASTHGGLTLSRLRRRDNSESPYEIHVIQFPNRVAFQAFMDDPSRLALTDRREEAITRTEVIEVEQISS